MKLVIPAVLTLFCAVAFAAEPGRALLAEFEAAAPAAAAEKKELLAQAESRTARVRLLAWSGLRAMGVQPGAREAWIVRGVALEARAATGVVGVAVYEDGEIHWRGENGGGMRESPGGDKELQRLVRTLLASAEPAMKTTRPMPHADASPIAKDRVRMTILTYAGVYVIDVHGSALDAQHPVREPFDSATEILRIVN